MFPAARKTDLITHDQIALCGVIAPPVAPCTQGRVVVENLPAAHVNCTVVCTGVVSGGTVHPPAPPTPPVPIVTGSPTVLIHGLPAARWVPSGDISACLVFLGNPALSAARSVLIGNGVATVRMRIVIIAGTAYDTPEGRARIAAQIARMQEVTGMAVQVTEVITVDAPSLQHATAYGAWNGTNNYTGGEALDALTAHGDPNTPTVIYTDQVQRPDGQALNGIAVSNAWAGTNDSVPNEGIVVSDGVTNETTAHEMGHLLSGEQGSNLHSTDPDNIMYGSGVAGRHEWTDPWRSSAGNSPFVTQP